MGLWTPVVIDFTLLGEVVFTLRTNVACLMAASVLLGVAIASVYEWALR